MRKLTVLIALGLPVSAGAQEAPLIPHFTDETASAGLDHKFTGEWEFMVGGGVATFDCNGDRKPEMLLAGGTEPASFYLNASPVGGALSFTKATSGLELDSMSGAYPLDIDSDGMTDLILLRVGENKVMRGLGNCKFAEANKDWGFDGGDAWSTAFSAMWEKGADWPTIAIGNYIDRTQTSFPWGSCTDNWLHRGGKAGFDPALPLKPSFCALSMLFTDWNRSGTPSLRISNDREYYKGGTEQMWHLVPGEAPVPYKPDEGWKPLKIWGMGIASSDVTGDGRPEYFLTSMADSKLQTLADPAADPAKPTFADIAFKRGVIAQRPYMGGDFRPSTGWHAQFEDVNNDGLADLFVAKGNVWEMPDFAEKDPNNMLLQQVDGTFVEAGEQSGVGSFRQSRGAMLTDFNLDGLMDLVVVNRNDGAELWRNTTADAGQWIEVRLEQTGANRDGIGSWLEVKQGDKVTSREITSGGGHVSGQLGWWHMGLGGQDQAELRVIWPDGTVGPWEKLAADGFYVLRPGQAAELWVAQ